MHQNFSSQLRHAARLTSARFPLYVPLALLCLASLVLGLTSLDLKISSYFYNSQLKQWPLSDKNPWEFIDQWCVLPGFILGVSSLLLSNYGLLWRRSNHWTRGAFLIATVFLIGPGLLVNGTMKPAFSRPRPREVIQMGGEQAYQPAFGFGEKMNFNASFPSGHASIGFFLIAPAFLFRRKHRTRRLILISGLLLGSVMSLSRIVQGGHYLSDVLWSLAIIYFTSWITLTLMLTHELKQSKNGHLNKEDA
ncbi:MAG: phosphatase PAP2 family protein, partial [Planctomycetaceae bacterium]|nr:phosphatase PAP2 family protein [Planctomycetaceae bacterium]